MYIRYSVKGVYWSRTLLGLISATLAHRSWYSGTLRFQASDAMWLIPGTWSEP